MPVRSKTLPTSQELSVFMNQNGLDVGQIAGPYMNSTGHLFIMWDESDGETVVFPPNGAAGVSVGSIVGAGTIEVLAKRTPVAAESFGAITDQTISETLASGQVVPGTVVINNTGATGPVIVDNGAGLLIEQVSGIRRGLIDYVAKTIAFTYPANAQASGDLEVDYEHTDRPDSADVPATAELVSISVSGAAGDIVLSIYEDEALTTPVFTGTVTVVGGVGDLPIGRISRILEAIDLTKRDRRWVVVDGTCTVNLYWKRF